MKDRTKNILIRGSFIIAALCLCAAIALGTPLCRISGISQPDSAAGSQGGQTCPDTAVVSSDRSAADPFTEPPSSLSADTDTGENVPVSDPAAAGSGTAEEHPDTSAPEDTFSSPETTVEASDTASPSTEPQTEPLLPKETTAADPIPDPVMDSVSHAMVFTVEDGVLFSKGEMNGRLYPASITKLVTALTVLSCVDPDTVFTVGDELDMVQFDASVADIQRGRAYSVTELLYGMLLPSGCDAAYTLAANVGFSVRPECRDTASAVRVFCSLMDKWAASNSLVGSSWGNPDGYHTPDLYTTMADLSVVARKSMENDLIRTICGTPHIKGTTADGTEYEWENSNLLIHPSLDCFNEYCIGLKTGMTYAAGNCLLSAFVKDGKTAYIGVFGCELDDSRYRATNWLFSEFIK